MGELSTVLTNLATIIFLWQQNQIFKRQNEIFAIQAGLARPEVRNGSQPSWLKEYWPFVAWLFLAFLTFGVFGYGYYRQHPTNVSWWKFSPLLLGLAGFLVLGIRWRLGRKRPSQASDFTETSTSIDPPPATLDVADVLVEYSHDDREGSAVYSDLRGAIQRGPNGIIYQHTAAPSRDRPLILKNITPGKNALNVRVQPVEHLGDKLVFRPDIITCIVGSGSAEVVPAYEGTPLPKSGQSRFRLNHLPDFLDGLYDRNERNDKESLDELFRENSLWLEIEYESEGKRIISECELLFTRWHEQIRTGQHRVRLAKLASTAASIAPAAAPAPTAVSAADWRDLSDRFKAIPADVGVQWQQTGPDDKATHRWTIEGRTLNASEEYIALCSFAGAMLRKSPTVSRKLSDTVLRQQPDNDRWLLYLKESGAISNVTYIPEPLDDGSRLPHFLGRINGLGSVSARMCLECAAMEL